MDKREKKELRKDYRKLIKDLNLTPDQVAFLLTQYVDEDFIIGIHNTMAGYDNIFKQGLRNQNSQYKNTDELANTINYNDKIWTLLAYANLQQSVGYRQSIILKIPKKVFSQEQGIFEELPDGFYGIPSQFIVGAFEDGQVIENEKYDREYSNPEAGKISQGESVVYRNKQERADLFMEEYNRFYNSRRSRFSKFIKRIFGGKKEKTLMLESGEEQEKENDEEKVDEKSRAAKYREEYRNPIDEQSIIKRVKEDSAEKSIQPEVKEK